MKKNNDPIVSVILPTYNRAQFLWDAIYSVLNQTFSGFEIIVVDDGSTDNTEQIIKKFLDPRIIYIKQINQGRSHARNTAIKVSRGKYITFLDSDDLYLPNKLEIQVNYLNNHKKVDMVYTSAYCIDANGKKLKENYQAFNSGNIYNLIAFYRPITITLPTVMIRRNLLNKVDLFDENMVRFEDTDMWRRISKISSINAINEFTCKLRTHPENHLLNQSPDQIIDALNYYSKKIQKEDTDKGKIFLRRGLSRLNFFYCRSFFKVHGWKRHAIILLSTSLKYWPLIFVEYFINRLRYYLFNYKYKI